MICLPSSIVLKYRLVKKRNELLGHPVVRSSFCNEKFVWYILSVRVSVTHEFYSRIKAFRIRESREWKRRDEIKRQDDQKHLGI